MYYLTFSRNLILVVGILNFVLPHVFAAERIGSYNSSHALAVNDSSNLEPFESQSQNKQAFDRDLGVSQLCLDQLSWIIRDHSLTAQLFSPNYFEASTYTELCDVNFLINFPKPVIICHNHLVAGWGNSNIANYCMNNGGQFTLYKIKTELEYFRIDIESLAICTGAACNTADLAPLMTELYADIFPGHTEFIPLDNSTRSPTISPAPTSSACVRDMIQLWAHENVSPLHNVLNNAKHGSNCGFHGSSTNGMATCDVSQWGDMNMYMKTYCVNDHGGKYYEATLKGVSSNNPSMPFEYKHAGLCIPLSCSDDTEAIDAAEDLLVTYSISSAEITFDSTDSSSSFQLATTIGSSIISVVIGLGVIFEVY